MYHEFYILYMTNYVTDDPQLSKSNSQIQVASTYHCWVDGSSCVNLRMKRWGKSIQLSAQYGEFKMFFFSFTIDQQHRVRVWFVVAKKDTLYPCKMKTTQQMMMMKTLETSWIYLSGNNVDSYSSYQISDVSLFMCPCWRNVFLLK